MAVSRTKVEQGELTRAALLTAATEIFTEKGYAETSTEEIVQRARVTRGALYHHFAGKDALFLAVVERLQDGIRERVVAAAASAADPLARLTAGMETFLDACCEPAVRRIVLMEGPSVLGWAVWHEIDARCGRDLMIRGFKAAMRSGHVRRQPAEPLTDLFYGALTQAAMVVAHADDAELARKEMGAAVRRLLRALRSDAVGAA
ncbi:MAG TPA: helix-turn-helix domain-containing protein [Mycobacteriales bacterium]|nr:helix-turn-helix domain-containing protein [Mycobacteriales bacterium]